MNQYNLADFAQAAVNVADSEISAKKIMIPAGFGCSLQLAIYLAHFHGGKSGERLAGLQGSQACVVSWNEADRSIRFLQGAKGVPLMWPGRQ